MIIHIDDTFRLKSMDDRNWKLQEHRTPSRTRDGREPTPRWIDTGNYFSSIGHALRFVWELVMKRDGGDLSLGEAIERAEEIARRLEATTMEVEK